MIRALKIAVFLLAAGALGRMDLDDALAQEMYRPSKVYPVGERGLGYQVPPRPDCRPEDVIWIAQNSGSEVPWLEFCSSSYSITRAKKKKR